MTQTQTKCKIYRSAFYQGPDELLFGKRAIITFDGDDVLAQFEYGSAAASGLTDIDDFATERALGWHRFKRSDFLWPSREEVQRDLEEYQCFATSNRAIEEKYAFLFTHTRDEVLAALGAMS